MSASIASRALAALRWLAPSAVAACAGAVAGGAVEHFATTGTARPPPSGPYALAVELGFASLALVPALLALSLAARALVAAGRLRALVDALVDADGAAPRLAGWVAVLWLGLAALAWSAFQVTWLLNAHTAWKPQVVGLAEPLFATLTLLTIAALSRPAARLVALAVGAADRRWRRGGRRSLVTPRAVALVAVAAGGGLAYLAWAVIVKPKVRPLPLAAFAAPLAALVALLGAHAAWRPVLRARRWVALAAPVLATACAATAALATRSSPDLVLALWADRPIAALAIDRAFSVDAIRVRVSRDPFAPVQRGTAPHPDLVLITIDGVRADRTLPYGGRDDLPLLRDLAARGAVFEWAFAPSSAGRRALPSIATGLAANHVRARADGALLRVDPRHVLLAERLRAGGYDTAEFLCCDDVQRAGLALGADHLEIDARPEQLGRDAANWITARTRTAPLFVWVHLDGPVTAADAAALQIVSAFARRPPDRSPIVILAADHGDSGGERGAARASDLGNAQLRVPLVMAGPGVRAQRIAETVSLVDLVPTIIELAGFQVTGLRTDGRSLASLAAGTAAPQPDGGLAFAAAFAEDGSPASTAIVRGKWKLVQTGETFELFDTRGDPTERANVLAAHGRDVIDLRTLLDARQASGRENPF